MRAAIGLLAASLLTGAARAAPVRDYYAPALEDYRADAKDFAMFEAAIAGALKAAPALFPNGIGEVDVIMQDTSEFFLYSRNPAYPYPKLKRWGKYQVYRFPHRRPQEHEMWGCAGGPPSVMEVDDRRIIAERSIRCSPWGSFRRAQERKKSYYRFEKAYLATMIHEYGHQYEDIKTMDPTPEMLELRRRTRDAKLPEGVERAAVEREAFAEFCELKGSKTLYPGHFSRLSADAKRKRVTSNGHHEALIVAVGMLEPRYGELEAPK